MRILLVAVLLAACADDGVRHTPDASPAVPDAAIDAPPPDPASLSASPGATDFGDVVIGQASAKVTYTIANDGGASSGPLAVILDSSMGFATTDNHCSGVSLGAGETCTFAVAFTPAVAGAAMSTVHVSGSPGGDVARDLTGNGLQPGAIDILETGHDFLAQRIDGTPTTHTFTVKNTGQVATGVPSAQTTGSTGYSVSSTTCNAALAPNATCSVVVRFAPPTVGAKPATVVVTSSPGGSDSATLSGTGVAHVAITKTGNGGGVITSNVAGINCGSTCAADFSTTPVSLSATANVGSTFMGWGSACSGAGSCTLNLTASKTVSGAFQLQRFALTTSALGTGMGTITGAGTYDYNTPVTVTATAATGSTFGGWGGACSGMGSCVVTMTQAKTVTATFTLQRFALTTATNGSGAGTITGAGTYDYNTPVTVTATPSTGSTFGGFTGACTGMTNPCTVTMTSAKTVTATFNTIPETLTVSTTGNGSVTSAPSGINCGTQCSASFAFGLPVTLTPHPATGQDFVGWGGDCTGTGTCTVTMDQAHMVTAQFAPKQFTFNLSFLGDSSGSVTIGSTTYTANASFTVTYGQQLTLSEQPVAGANVIFAGWGGACSGTATTCTVTIAGDTDVSAEFDQGAYRYVLTAITADTNWFFFDVTYPNSTTTTAECQSSASPGTNCAAALPRGT
ncbi:MAG: choice-of-anchor D domain-containing protein, partial [Deltaproteobacteria bacterium]|nr:choice-of-anchor D domain-containing protein [Deltaproteobacteria bacterium]